MNIRAKSMLKTIVPVMLGLSVASLAAGFAPPPGRGGGGGGGGKDTTPPAAVNDLAVVAWTHRGITVQWTATGDDGNEGTGSQYLLRYAFEEITESNWDSATGVGISPPAPGPPGTLETADIVPLFPGLDVHIAIRVVDDNDNISSIAVGSVVSASTDPAPATPWAVVPVLEGGQSGGGKMAIDPAGFPSIAFVHRSPADEVIRLNFARWNGDSWEIEVIPTEAVQDVMDHRYDPTTGLPIILHTGLTKFLASDNLTWYDGAQWQTEFVEEVGSANSASMAFAPDGTITIATWRRRLKGNRADDDLVLARRIAPGSWETEVVAANTVARRTSLQFHPVTGDPMIAFGDNDVTLASFDGTTTTWQFESVPINSTFRDVKLAIDPLSGEPAIIGPATDGGAELCTRVEAGIWNCEVFHPNRRAGNGASLLFAADGTPIIAHSVGAGSAGKIAYFSFRDNLTGLWIHEEIDVNGYVVLGVSMVPTPWGTFMVAFSREIFDGARFDDSDLFFAERIGN